MSQTDQPRQPRPLFSQAPDSLADGRPDLPSETDQDEAARPPGELLDELRKRLSRLPGNHPSSLRQARPSAESPRWDAPWRESGEPGWADMPDLGASGADDARPDQQGPEPGAPESGQPEPGDPGSGNRDGRQATPDWAPVLASDLLAGELLPDSGGEHEAYRPWFMSGDVSAPWFAAPES